MVPECDCGGAGPLERSWVPDRRRDIAMFSNAPDNCRLAERNQSNRATTPAHHKPRMLNRHRTSRDSAVNSGIEQHRSEPTTDQGVGGSSPFRTCSTIGRGSPASGRGPLVLLLSRLLGWRHPEWAALHRWFDNSRQPCPRCRHPARGEQSPARRLRDLRRTTRRSRMARGFGRSLAARLPCQSPRSGWCRSDGDAPMPAPPSGSLGPSPKATRRLT